MSANTISLSINDYPQLATLITGQEVEMMVTARVGLKIMGSQEERITFITETIEVVPDHRPSTQEVLLANIANHTSTYSKPTP